MKQLISFFLITFIFAGEIYADTDSSLVQFDISPEPKTAPLATESANDISPAEAAIQDVAVEAGPDAVEASDISSTTQVGAQFAPSSADTEVVVLRDPANLSTYLLSPGDALEITVWKEEGLQQQQFLIGPDGNIIYPLIGTVTAAGRTINDLKELLTVKLADFIADPSISVKLLSNQGNTVFVIGKVNKPGQVVAGRRIDVLQALSLAGGLTVFADDDDITIQRRIGDKVIVFPFDYSDVINGEDLEQNILLEPGDTIAVP